MYVAKLKNNIVHSIRFVPTDYALSANEREITKEQFNSISLPAIFDENGELVHTDTFPVTEPISVTEGEPTPEAEPTQIDVIEAQVYYTAMMTDTLLEE